MFPFHKPKVFRSSAGCCICKAKSSSSRFTDSRKYEDDFEGCFQLGIPRQGDICNACVLLVKRFKRLPSGSERHWGHVVDARDGPGIKSMNKCKKKREEQLSEKSKFDCEGSPAASESWGSDKDGSDEEVQLPRPPVYKPRKSCVPTKRSSSNLDVVDFRDSLYWKKENVCCGSVWKSSNGAVVLDTRYYKPCVKKRVPVSPKKADAPLAKVFSDNSSDSGYDESSNLSASVRALSKDALLLEAIAQHGLMDSEDITMLKKKLVENSKAVLSQAAK